MRYQALTSGLRVTFTASELKQLLNLARFGRDSLEGSPYFLTEKEAETAARVIAELEAGQVSVRWKQAEAKARRDAPKREEERRRAREHFAVIEGWSVSAMIGDWTDVSPDPDYPMWRDMFNPDTQPREQGEIRRNVSATRGQFSDDTLEYLPNDCTETADRAEIEPLVHRMIARISRR